MPKTMIMINPFICYIDLLSLVYIVSSFFFFGCNIPGGEGRGARPILFRTAKSQKKKLSTTKISTLYAFI